MDTKISLVKQTTMTDGNKSVPAIEVTFMVGTHGPFTETFPKATFSAAAVNQKLAELAGHIKQLQ
jgi:hypothetical protein